MSDGDVKPKRRAQKPKKLKSPAKKPLLLQPPPKLPEEIEELFANNDFIELEYRRMAEMRQQKQLTSEQRKALAEHDAVERQIAQDPKAALVTAYQNLDRGTALLLKLIRSHKLHRRYLDKHGNVFSEWDEAVDCLVSRLDFLNRELMRLARANAPNACSHLWSQAKALAQEFTRLALVYPDEFQSAAETSLTMPSLRGQNPKFTADAEAIIKAIHLGEKHPAGEMTKDHDRIGELCGVLVADILDSVVDARRQYDREKENVERLRNFHETADAYRDMTVEESLRRKLYPTLFEHVIASAALPEFRDDPKQWWLARIKPMLREEFDRLKKNPSLNMALWHELGRSTLKGEDGARWKALHDNCRNKVNQLARRAGAKTFA